MGKSYIAKEFAQNEYENHVWIDFSVVNPVFKTILEENAHDLDRFFQLLSTLLGKKFYERKTLFVLDEIQNYPFARSMIKHFVAYGKYDFIETGSLISIKENVKDILIPSEERKIELNPMDFEEFLWAVDNSGLKETIDQAFQSGQEMRSLHKVAMNAFREYMVVGGMPQAVALYAATKDLATVDRCKRDVLALYRDDIAKHCGRYTRKVESMFDEIPDQLSKHEKRFNFSSLDKNARYRNYQDAILWLEDGRIVNLAYNASDPDIGLHLNMDRMTLKCYMADTGLLISHAFDENQLAREEIHKRLMFDKLEINKGMLLENVVAQMLRAAGSKLYFYSKADNENPDNRMEIDFLLAKSSLGSRKNIMPLEVKSGRNYRTDSLDKFRAKFKSKLGAAYVIHTKDYRRTKECVFLPIYMLPSLLDLGL